MITRQLNQLHRLNEAGERGYVVVAENVRNRGLKIILKSFAQQRAEFAQALEDEIRRLGGGVSQRESIRGVIHRGRINIQATMTINAHSVEEMVLKEAIRGENVIVKTYERCLKQELPAETKTLLETQYQAVKSAREQIELLCGRDGKQLVVRLFDSAHDAETAVQALVKAGYDRSQMEIDDVEQETKIYQGEGTNTTETVISGAFGGLLWGSLIGLISGIGLAFIPEMMSMSIMEADPMTIWIGMVLAGAIFGALFGAIFGLLISRGTAEDDAYLYDDSVKFGTHIIQLVTNEDRSKEAAQILHQVNAAARANR